MNYKLLDNGMIKIFGDYTNFYNADNDSIDNTCEITFFNCTLEEIDEECMILSVDSNDFTVKDRRNTNEMINKTKIEYLNYLNNMKKINEKLKKFNEYIYDEIYITPHDEKNFEHMKYYFCYGRNFNEYGGIETNDLLFHLTSDYDNWIEDFREEIQKI